MEELLDRKTVGFSLSYAIASIFSALLVVVKEEFAPIKDAMKALTGHHWATHGILTIIVFLIFGYLLAKKDLQDKYDTKKLSGIVVWSTIIATVIISGYMLYHNLAA